MEELLFILLLKKDINKLFIFYWKKEKQMLIFQIRFFFLIVSFSFFFFFFLFFSFFFFFFLFFSFFFTFSFFFFFNVKDGATPLFIAASKGDEQIVEILLEKGKANVDLPDKVILLFVFFFFSFLFSFFFFFHFLIFLFFLMERMEKLLFMLLLKKDINKLLKFYWKKENQMLILQLRLFWLFLSFSFSHFSIFFNVKYGETPLYVAAQKGHKQIVEILLEKGKPNVDLPDPVLLLIVFFFFFFFFFFFSFFYFF